VETTLILNGDVLHAGRSEQSAGVLAGIILLDRDLRLVATLVQGKAL